MAEDRANAFLRMIRRAQRGRLKVYLGYCAGVGKTYQMLQEGLRLKGEGLDAVVGLLETHGRADIVKLGQGLEFVPRRKQEYHGVLVEEMDLDAVLARKPKVALIDELAHTNVPGSRNAKRYQDVQEILDAGIHVITTMNVQHLESLYNTVENAVGVKVRERMPDSVLAEADQIVDVDVTTEDLRRRLQEGKIYPKERIETALSHFFKTSNLEKLRELALRELASQIDLRRRETPEEEGDPTPDQVMVCLSSRGPNSEKLLRYASRLAGKLNRNWYAVYVQTRAEQATTIDARTQRLLAETLTLAKQLGAIVFTYKGEDVAETILRFAREYRVGHIVIGRPMAKPFWKKFGKNKRVFQDLVKKSKGVTMILLDTADEKPVIRKMPVVPEEEMVSVPADKAAQSNAPDMADLLLSRLLTPRRIVIWDKPVQKEVIMSTLVVAAWNDIEAYDLQGLFDDVMRREKQGSTFFNEGVAFPHVRVEGLVNPIMALGLTRQGVSDLVTEKPIELVFLILSPAQNPHVQVQILGLASQAALNRRLLQDLKQAQSALEVMSVIQNWELLSQEPAA